MRPSVPCALLLASLLSGAAVARGAEEPVRVRLLDPGRAPLKALRYRAKAGQTAQMTMSMKMGMAMKLGGQALPATPVPEMRCGVDLKITEVTPAGDMKYDFLYSSFEVVSDPATSPAVLDAMRKSLAGLQGLRGRGVTNSRGFTQEGRIELPPGADPQLKQIIQGLQQSMKQFSAPLPEEPVGVGARWETTYALEQGGIRIDQVAKNEVKSIDGDRLVLAFSLVQSAPPQRIASGDLPASARMDLVSLASTGQGGSTVDLGGLIAASAKVTLRSVMKMRMEMAPQPPQDIETTMDMTMAVSGR